MGVPVEKLPHSCGTRRGLQVFLQDDGSYDGYCYSCGVVVSDPYGDKPKGYKPQVTVKTPEEIQREIREIRNLPQMALDKRRITEETARYFGIRVGLDEARGQDVKLHYFPYTEGGKLVGYKVRLIDPKRMWSVGNLKGDVDLFGWERAIRTGSPTLYITEGEYDAMALYQIMTDRQRGTQYEDRTPAVVSLAHGAAAAAHDLAALSDKIRRQFKEVVLVFDMDEPGQKAAKDCALILPEAKVVSLPAKDANDCLLEGKSKACFNAVRFNSERPKNTRLVMGSQLKEAAKKKPEWGLSWPWQALTEATRGIRRGETIYFGAGVKMGKSEIVNAVASHLIVEHNKKVLIVKPEEAMAKTYQMLVGKVAGRIFHDPKIEFDEQAFDKAEPLVGDKAIIVDSYQFVDWDTLKNDIKYAVQVLGVEDVILDPITCFTNQMGAAEANEFLVRMAAEISAMSKDMGFTAYIFCHLKAPAVGASHERGGAVISSQFAGSRAMMRSCNYMIGMEGNKDPELDELERNTRTLVILEDREFGVSARIPLFWDKNTGVFSQL